MCERPELLRRVGMVLLLISTVFVILMTACSRPNEPRALNRAMARGAIVELGIAVDSAATQCTAYSQWLGRFGADQQENADRLFNVCVRRLGPARDSVVFAPDLVDPWTPRSAAVIGCAGKAVRVALEALRVDFVAWRVREPELMEDGIHLGRWAEQYALPSCDPLHPTTTVQLLEDPRIPRIDPIP